MMPHWKAALSCGSAILALTAGTLAQDMPQPPAPAGQAPQPAPGQTPFYPPQQLPAQRGQVQQFTMTPRGDIDGLILSDGTEVKTPPHLSAEIAYSIKPGDTVTVHGLRAAALPLVQAVSITDDATGRTVIDYGRLGPRRGPGAGWTAPIPGPTAVQGRVRIALHGREGEVNGILLEDGTVLRLPPPEAYRFAALLQPGQTVFAEGAEFTTPIGKVLEVWRLGTSRDQLSQLQLPAGPSKARKKGRRGPPAVAGLAPGLPPAGFAPPPPPQP
jgi:hypothetical protein